MSDISKYLNNWNNIPNSSIRKILGDDGRPKIQIRIDQGAFRGILQMELEGRPDGFRPEGFDFYLDLYKSKLKSNADKNGSQVIFRLDFEDCKKLFDESSRIYSRYSLLLEIEDYRRVVRDTEKNMELFKFVRKYAADAQDQNKLEKWWPFLIRINAVARIMLAMDEKDHARALQIIKEARKKINDLEEQIDDDFLIERERSLGVLNKIEGEIQSSKPISNIDRLKNDLREAVIEENFEHAAELRDLLRGLGVNPEFRTI